MSLLRALIEPLIDHVYDPSSHRSRVLPTNGEEFTDLPSYQDELTYAIEQMMFVAGETGEPSSETTTLIEQIVHEQVFEMVSTVTFHCLFEVLTDVPLVEEIHRNRFSTWLPFHYTCRSLLSDSA